jgi:hypothetical protein
MKIFDDPAMESQVLTYLNDLAKRHHGPEANVFLLGIKNDRYSHSAIIRIETDVWTYRDTIHANTNTDMLDRLLECVKTGSDILSQS